MAGLTGKSSPHDLYTPPPKAAPAPVAPVSPVKAAAQAATPQKPQFDLSSLLKGFGQPQAPQGPMTNTSTANPTITKINESQMKAFEGDMNAGALGRASDIAIRDNAENERKAARQNAASRGVSGGGIEDIQQGGITRDVLRNQAGARVGITNDAEARRASLGGQIAGQAALDENLQNQQRVTAMNQQAQYAQQQQTARQTELSNIRNIIDLFGEDDLFSGAPSGPTSTPIGGGYSPGASNSYG